MKQNISRRNFLHGTGLAAGLLVVDPWLTTFCNVFGTEADRRWKIGICDWDLRATGHPGAFEVARELGFDGVEVSWQPEGEFTLSKAENRPVFLESARKSGREISSLAMGVLNGRPLSTTPEAESWVENCIETLVEMKLRVVLLAFFGADNIQDNSELRQKAVEKLKRLAPKAEKRGVILGIESWMNARGHLDMLDKIGSDAVKVYYDEQNMLTRGYPIYDDLEILLKEKVVCRIHAKENGFRLGEGKVDFTKIRDLLEKYDYKDWIVAESSVKGDWKKSQASNADYLKRLFKK